MRGAFFFKDGSGKGKGKKKSQPKEKSKASSELLNDLFIHPDRSSAYSDDSPA